MVDGKKDGRATSSSQLMEHFPSNAAHCKITKKSIGVSQQIFRLFGQEHRWLVIGDLNVLNILPKDPIINQ